MDGHYLNGTLNYASSHAPIATTQPHHGLPTHYPQAAYQAPHQPSYTLPSLAPLQPQRPSGNYAPVVYDQSSQMPPRSQMTSHQLPSSQTSQPSSYLHYPTTIPSYAPTQPNTQNHSLNSNYAQQNLLQPAFQHSNASMPELSRLPSLPYQLSGTAPTNTTANGQPLRTLPISLATLDSSRIAHPAHVVGSQGRRGILPSVESRPSAVQNTDASPAGPVMTNGKNVNAPSKDADGKFPCPHCNKTYLHAKHLKRHLLRREYSAMNPMLCDPNPNQVVQIPAIDPTCVYCVPISFHGVTS